MVNKGAFDDLNRKIELIDGEIIAMNPAGPVHDYLIEYLTHWSVLNTKLDQVRVRIQSGLSLIEFDSRPEPDVLWVKADHLRDRHPTADDVLLLIEVSDSSLNDDRNRKLRLYATAGIREYWIVSVADERIYVHRTPTPDGFRETLTVKSGESISPLVEPAAVLDPDKLFGDGTEIDS